MRTMFLAAAVALLFQASPSISQSAADLAQAEKISQRYNECVYFAAISRVKPGNGNDISALAEEAFNSCTSESEQLVLFLSENGATATQIQSVILEKKTGIKRELRNMINEVLLGKKLR